MLIGIDGRPLQEKSGGVKEVSLGMLHALWTMDTVNRYHVFFNATGGLALPDLSRYPNVSTGRGRWPNKLLNLSTAALRLPKTDCLAGKGAAGPFDAFFMPNLNFAALRPETKLVLAVHDLSFRHFPEFYSFKRQLWHRAVRYERLIRRADRILAVSESTKRDIMDSLQIPEEKITVVPPVLTLKNTAASEDSAVLTRHRLAPGYLLFLGTLEPRKNIEGLLEAYALLLQERMADLPDLVIAGPVGWRTKSIFRLAEKISSRRIHFLRYITPEDKPALYRNAAAFIFPSFYEGIGLPPMEAASLGIPVIASSSSSLPEMLGGAALSINPWNVRELAEAIKLLCRRPELRARLAAAGTQGMRRFTAEKTGQALLRLFEETHTMPTYANRH